MVDTGSARDTGLQVNIGPAVRLADLSKSYREGDRQRVVLHDANAEFAPGEFVALLGRSGSGKSTLLNLISGIDRPDSGAVWIGDRELTAMDERERTLFRRRNIGFIFQFFNLIPTLSVMENVTLPLELDGRSARQAAAAAEPLLARSGCSTVPAPTPTASRAASSSGWRSRAHWCMTRCWYWPTSPPATWTRIRGGWSWPCWTG